MKPYAEGESQSQEEKHRLCLDNVNNVEKYSRLISIG